MTDFSSSTFPRPKDWQAFERHSRVLFEHILGDPNTQNNGRAGQPQHGVDIYGKRGGGSGPLVGIQCKGKDSGYGGTVARSELRCEVAKTEKFKPDLKEFILITTAPDDAGIQEEARLLEREVRAGGRDLSIAVWGWETIHQRIVQYPDVIKAFHPDASPFSDVLRNDVQQVKDLIRQDSERRDTMERRLRAVESRTSEGKFISPDATSPDTLDKTRNDEIDRYRDLIRNDQPRTAIKLLIALKEQTEVSASPKIMFRILTNVGAAYHRLGEFDKAADFFLEAAPLRPDDPVSMSNAIAANLFRGQLLEAHQLALKARDKYPDRHEIAIQRLQARAAGETVSDAWEQLPSSTKERPNATLFRVIATREEGIDDWRVVADEALSAFPEDPEIRIIHAEATVDRVLSPDPRCLGLQTCGAVPSIKDVATAACALDEAWRTSLGKETPAAVSHAHNAALAFNLIGNYQKSAELLDAAFESGSVNEATKRLRISLFVREGKVPEALKLAYTLLDTPMSRVIRAELTARTDPVAARNILSDRDTYTEKTDIIGAAYVVIDSLLAEPNFKEARLEAKRLEEILPDDPEAIIAMFRVLSAAGDADAAQHLERAIARIGPETSSESRMLVADCLSQAGRNDDVVDLLYGSVDYTLDSFALRLLIQSAASADRRKILGEALAAVPGEIRNLPFYRRARAALALCTGNIDKAEQEVRGFLEVEPRSLNMHLQLLQILARREKIDELRAEVARPASDFDGQPQDFVFYAQFKDKFGSWQEAYDIAYRCWLSNQGNAAVCVAYTGLFLRPGQSNELDIAPKQVEVGMAVSIEATDGTKEIYVLEADQSLRPSPKHLSPDHKLAACLLNRKVGDWVELPDGFVARLLWIKPKYLHALHEILESFGNLFPDVSAIEKVRFDAKTQGGLQPIVDRLRGRHDSIESVFGTYERGQIPITIAGQALGFDPVRTLGSLVFSGRSLRVCEGTEPERDAALRAVDDNQARGCMVDAITLHVMRRLNLCEAVAAVCGPIGIVDATASRLQREAEKLAARIDEEDMSLFWKDGQVYREIADSAMKRQALQELQDDRQWIEKNAKIIPAQGSTDLSLDMRSLVARFGSAFVDDAIAAQDAGVILVSEDQSFRRLADAEFGVKTTWLQPVLMRAKDRGHLTSTRYREAIRRFIESGFEFVSVDSDMLVGELSNVSAVPLPKGFNTIASRLGGVKADMRSHLGVAFGAIQIFWNDRTLPDLVKSAAVGCLLENLTKNRPIEHVLAILVQAIRFGKNILADRTFNQYVETWRIGHFIDIPRPD